MVKYGKAKSPLVSPLLDTALIMKMYERKEDGIAAFYHVAVQMKSTELITRRIALTAAVAYLPYTMAEIFPSNDE